MNIKYVLGFALTKDKKSILMIKKTKPSWQAGLMNAIGGKIESYDENHLFALTREFKEETNLDTSINDWKMFNIIKSSEFELYCMVGFFDNFNGYETTTEEEVVLMNIDDLQQSNFANCIPNLKWLIPLVLDDDINRIRLNTHYLD